MNLDDFLRDELVKFERQLNLGDRTALVSAFDLCTENSYPFPAWLKHGIRELLVRAVFPKARGKRSPETMMGVHQMRWSLAKLGRGLSRHELQLLDCKPIEEATAADVFASRHLEKSPAHGTPAQVKDSYERVEAAIRAGDRQDSIVGTAIRVRKRNRVAKRAK